MRSRPEGARVNAATTAEELRDLQNDFEQPQRTAEGNAKRLAATRKYMGMAAQPSATTPAATTGTTTAPAQAAAPGAEQPASAPATAPDEPITAGGDSLGSHLVRAGVAVGQEDRRKVGSYRAGDTAVAGWNSTKILNDLIPKLPKDKVEGKTVAWSTGVSNEPDAAAVQKAITENVPKQIAALKDQKAKNIVIMGVGPAEKLKGANEALAKVAQENGVLFAGPQRAPNAGDPEKLHSSDQAAEIAAVREALAKRGGQAAAGQIEPGNIDLNKRPVVKNPDGSISTVRSMSVNFDGKEVLIPTVAADGSRILSDEEAIDQYKKTGQHLGKFDTPEHATAYAEQLHNQQAQQYGTGGTTPAAKPGATQAAPTSVIPDLDKTIQSIYADPSLTPAAREKAVTVVTARYNHVLAATAVERGELTKSLNDGVAALEAGQEWAPPSDATLARVLPPAALAEAKDKISEAQDFGRVRNQAWFASPEDIAKQSGQIQAGLQDTATPGFARRARHAAQFEKIVTLRNKQLQDDPAAFVAQSPPVAAAYAAAAANPTPETTQAAVRASLAEQDRLGVLPENQHVLSKGQAEKEVSKIANMDPETTDYAPILDAYAKLYGPHWNQAFGDMVKMGLPDSAQILGTMVQPDQAAYRTDFERMIKFTIQKGGAEQLKKNAGAAGKAVDENIENQLEVFRATVQGDQKLYATVHNAVRDLAYYYALQLNDGKAAVEKAYEGILGRKYDFENTYRAPKGSLGTVDAAANELLSTVTPDAVRDPGGGDPNLTADYRKRQEYAAIQNGRWVNNQNDDGLIRMSVRRDGQTVPSRRADGSVIQFKFSEAPGIIARRPPPPQSFTPTEIDPRIGLQ